MKHLFSTFAGLTMVATSVCAFPANAQEVSMPSVRPGDVHCFSGLPKSQIEYLPVGESKKRQIMRGPKLEDTKYDNYDGHNLREVTTEGNYKVLVVLVEFQDVKFSQGKGDPKSLIDQMLNSDSYTYQNAAGSANAYYRTISNGLFNPIFNVVGPITLSKKEEQYVVSDPNDTYIYPESGKPVTCYQPGRMVEEAVAAIDGEIEFSEYDSNKDGYVDFIYFFHAGQGATTGGDTKKTIWPHAFTLTSAIGAPVEHDGVLINRYATSAEIGSDKRLTGIGTFCHEFAHVLGLPDLYDTENNNGQPSKCFSPGSFDCMDAGDYNNNHKSPATFSVYERYGLEWMKPVTLTGGGNFTMLPLEAHPFGYKVNSSNNDYEYFLLENRGNTFYDQYLEGHGLLVWHIDFDLNVWNAGKVNNNQYHQCIDLIEADNDKTSSTRSGDTFPGTEGICEYTSTITPAFKDWSNKSVGFELSEIRHNFDSTTEFIVTSADGKTMPDSELAKPEPSVAAVSAESITIEWPAVKGAEKYFISVFPTNAYQGQTLKYSDYVEGYCYLPVMLDDEDSELCSCTIEGLKPNLNYSIMVYAAGENNASRMISPLTANTVDASDFDNAAANLYLEKADDVVVAYWDTIEGADDYELSIVNRVKGQQTEDVVNCDFTGNTLPQGWSAKGAYFNTADYAGAATPSYKFASTEHYLQTSLYDDCIDEVSFKATRRKKYDDNLCTLNIWTADKAGNWSLWKEIDDVPFPGKDYTLNLPADVYGLKFMYNFKSTQLYVCLDDIKLTFCKESNDSKAESAEIEMLGTNSAAVRGLKPGQEYVAYVTPKKEGVAGARSNEVAFNIEKLPVSGVEDIISDSADSTFRVEGNTIIPADNSVVYDVYSVDGLTVAHNHSGNLTLANRGIYLLRVADKSIKLRL